MTIVSENFTESRFGQVHRSHLTAIEVQQSETDHRIANSLQIAAAILKYESRRISTIDEANTALEDAALRLMAMARIHRQLCRDVSGDTVDLAEFFRRLRDDIAQSIGVLLEIRMETVRLPASVASQLCLVVNELAMNAVKHGTRHGTRDGKMDGAADGKMDGKMDGAADGQPVILRAEAQKTGDGALRLTLRDNGPGLPDGFSLDDGLDGGGLGMTIVTGTVDRLGGRIETLPGPGASFAITLPLNDPS